MKHGVKSTSTDTQDKDFDKSWKIGSELLAGLSNFWKQSKQPNSTKANSGLTYSGGSSNSIFGILAQAMKMAFSFFSSSFKTVFGSVNEPTIQASIAKMDTARQAMEKPGASLFDIGTKILGGYFPGFDLSKATSKGLQSMAEKTFSPTCSTPYKPTKK